MISALPMLTAEIVKVTTALGFDRFEPIEGLAIDALRQSGWWVSPRGQRRFRRLHGEVTCRQIELSIGIVQWATDHGWEKRWLLLFRRFGDEQVHYVPVMSQTFLVSPTGSLQTSTSDATWNNSNNSVECVGSGASGGATMSTTGDATGGGAGAYSKITNFTFASPGTTTYQWQVGTGGAAVTRSTTGATAGNNGASTWFNAASDPGNGSDNSKCSSAGGAQGAAQTTTGTANGGAGGLTTAGWGTTKHNGGRGGNVTASVIAVTGGGGAGGPTADGNTGLDNNSAQSASDGGSADNGGTGAGTGGASNGGTTGATAGSGGNGTEFDGTTHGCGGGGGGAISTGTGSGTANASAGSGGNYGGAGAGVLSRNSGHGGTSGAGIQGLIVLTWTPAVDVLMPQVLT